MQSPQDLTQGETIQSAPYRKHWSWKRIVGTIIIVSLFLFAIFVIAFPVARLSVTIHNPSVTAHAFVCIFIDHHNKTGLDVGPGEEIESAWQVYPGTHRVQVYRYFENYTGMNALMYSAPHKVEAFSTEHIQLDV